MVCSIESFFSILHEWALRPLKGFENMPQKKGFKTSILSTKMPMMDYKKGKVRQFINQSTV